MDTSDIENLKEQISASVSKHGTGGMGSKVEAAQIAQKEGIETWILNGLYDNFIIEALNSNSEFTKIVSDKTKK